MSNPYQSPSGNTGSSVDLTGFQLTPKCDQVVRVMQIIAIALLTGILMFLLFALAKNQFAMNGPPDMLNYIAIGLALLQANLLVFVPKLVATNAIKGLGSEELSSGDDESRFLKFARIYQTQRIVLFALLEGAAFLNIVAYMLSPYLGNLIVIAVLLSIFIVSFPTVASVQNWVASKARELGAM